MSRALKREQKYCPQIMDIFFPDSFPPVHILAPPPVAVAVPQAPQVVSVPSLLGARGCRPRLPQAVL